MVAHAPDGVPAATSQEAPGSRRSDAGTIARSREAGLVGVTLAVAVLVTLAGVVSIGRSSPAWGPCEPLPADSGEPGFGGWYVVNTSEWESADLPVFLFYGEASSAYVAIDSWVIWATLANFGVFTGVQFGSVRIPSYYPILPEVILTNASLKSGVLSAVFSESPSNATEGAPIPTSCTEQAYVRSYANDSYPLVVVGGKYVNGRGSDINFTDFAREASSAPGGAASIPPQILAESGWAWNYFHQLVWITMAFVVANLGISVPVLASEYGWTSTTESEVIAYVSQL